VKKIYITILILFWLVFILPLIGFICGKSYHHLRFASLPSSDDLIWLDNKYEYIINSRIEDCNIERVERGACQKNMFFLAADQTSYRLNANCDSLVKSHLSYIKCIIIGDSGSEKTIVINTKSNFFIVKNIKTRTANPVMKSYKDWIVFDGGRR
jgi:hypothetical protein